jgi:hypothetical protein
VLIHPRRIGPMANSCPIAGRATVIDDAIKGPLKQLRMATMRVARWELCIVSMNLNSFLHSGNGNFNLISLGTI